MTFHYESTGDSPQGLLPSVPLREVLKCFRGGFVASGVVWASCDNGVTPTRAGQLLSSVFGDDRSAETPSSSRKGPQKLALVVALPVTDHRASRGIRHRRSIRSGRVAVGRQPSTTETDAD